MRGLMAALSLVKCLGLYMGHGLMQMASYLVQLQVPAQH